MSVSAHMCIVCAYIGLCVCVHVAYACAHAYKYVHLYVHVQGSLFYYQTLYQYYPIIVSVYNTVWDSEM